MSLEPLFPCSILMHLYKLLSIFPVANNHQCEQHDFSFRFQTLAFNHLYWPTSFSWRDETDVSTPCLLNFAFLLLFLDPFEAIRFTFSRHESCSLFLNIIFLAANLQIRQAFSEWQWHLAGCNQPCKNAKYR